MASEKKRKRQSDGANGAAAKRVTFEKPSNIVKVTVSQAAEHWQPAIASAPGLTFPDVAKFKAYTKKADDKEHLFLHSDAHSTLDYTASEELPESTDPLDHYVGIYDPKAQTLELFPARQMTVRSTLKSSRAKALEAEGGTHISPQKMATRSELGLAFGTKKTKKAIAARASNAITSSKPLAEDKVATAILEAMPTQTVKKKDLQAQVDAAKPIPTPNLAAEKPADVYTIATLIGGDDFLAKIKATDWIDTFRNRGDVQTRSKIVSNRCRKVIEAGDPRTVRILRYLYLLICWFRSLRPAKMGKDTGLFIPKFGELQLTADHQQQPFMRELVNEFGKDFLPHLAEKFSEDGFRVTRWHQDKVISHILALILVIDNFETTTHEIDFDLRLDVKKITDYFKGLGCTAKTITKAEVERRNISKVEAAQMRKVSLKCPVKLPQGRGFAKRQR